MNELLIHAISDLEEAGFIMQAELDPLTMVPVLCADPEDQFYAERAVFHLSTNEASIRRVYHPLHIVEAGEY